MRIPDSALVFEFTREEGEYFVENATFSLFGHGATPLDALNDFLSDFDSTQQHYLSLNDDQVMGRGRELRRLFARAGNGALHR